MSKRTPLSSESKEARRPLPPGDLADARHDKVHRDLGRGRAARTHGGCEWNPRTNQPAWSNELHFRTTKAEVIVGANGQWRLCQSCAALPVFRRFRKRIPIRPPKAGER